MSDEIPNKKRTLIRISAVLAIGMLVMVAYTHLFVKSAPPGRAELAQLTISQLDMNPSLDHSDNIPNEAEALAGQHTIDTNDDDVVPPPSRELKQAYHQPSKSMPPRRRELAFAFASGRAATSSAVKRNEDFLEIEPDRWPKLTVSRFRLERAVDGTPDKIFMALNSQAAHKQDKLALVEGVKSDEEIQFRFSEKMRPESAQDLRLLILFAPNDRRGPCIVKPAFVSFAGERFTLPRGREICSKE